MKYFTVPILLLTVFVSTSFSVKCSDDKKDESTQDWIDMGKICISRTKKQIQEEINASMVYLAMGAHFSRDVINRPGFAEFFFKSASEEREHATKLIEYLLMRGVDGDVSNWFTVNPPSAIVWDDGLSALKAALDKEAFVTKSIRSVIKACEDDRAFNDYHFVDYLTGEFLEEQYHGQRDLAGKISTLAKLNVAHGPLGEFLYDKELLAQL